MSIQAINITPYEQGSAIVTITPTDEDGVDLVFAELTNPQWQLMKTNGTVINNRSFANSSMSSLEFVLSGDDLAIFSWSDKGARVLSFQATYDSTAGSGLPLVGECIFTVQSLVGQTDVN